MTISGEDRDGDFHILWRSLIHLLSTVARSIRTVHIELHFFPSFEGEPNWRVAARYLGMLDWDAFHHTLQRCSVIESVSFELLCIKQPQLPGAPSAALRDEAKALLDDRIIGKGRDIIHVL